MPEDSAATPGLSQAGRNCKGDMNPYWSTSYIARASLHTHAHPHNQGPGRQSHELVPTVYAALSTEKDIKDTTPQAAILSCIAVSPNPRDELPISGDVFCGHG